MAGKTSWRDYDPLRDEVAFPVGPAMIAAAAEDQLGELLRRLDAAVRRIEAYADSLPDTGRPRAHKPAEGGTADGDVR